MQVKNSMKMFFFFFQLKANLEMLVGKRAEEGVMLNCQLQLPLLGVMMNDQSNLLCVFFFLVIYYGIKLEL